MFKRQNTSLCPMLCGTTRFRRTPPLRGDLAHGNFLFPKRLVFLRETLPSSGFEEPDEAPTPSEGIRLKESAEKMPVHAKVASFFVINPDVQKHKAPWRLLSRRVVIDPKTKQRKPSSMQLYLSLKTPEERERFLAQPHIRAEIELEYTVSKRFYDKIPATMKAPQITVNHFERPKLEYDGEMVFMGGSLSKKVSQEIGGQSRRIEGNDPVSLLTVIHSMPEEDLEKLAGKPAIISFDPSIIKDVSVPQQVISKGNNAVNDYLQQQAEDQYLAHMRNAVAELNKYGANVIMVNQLNAYGLDRGNIYGQNNLKNRVAGILSKSMCQMYLDGQVDAVVDAKNGFSPSSIQIRPQYAAIENGQPTLNAKGIKGLANGVIAGINFGVLNIPAENNASADLGYYGLLDDGRARPNGNPEVEQYRKQMHVPMGPVSPETERFMKENASDLLGQMRRLETQSTVPSLKDATKVADLTSKALLTERQTKDTIDWNRYFEFRRLVSSLFLKVAKKAVDYAEKQKGSANYKKAVKLAKDAVGAAHGWDAFHNYNAYAIKKLKKGIEKL